jgi:ketosteroid isomerase-like protein
MNTDQRKIHRAIDDFIRAYNTGDVDRLLDVYTSDYIDMSDGESTLHGIEARRETEARLRDTFGKFDGRLTVEIDEIETSGDHAYDRGTLRVELRPKVAGEPVIVERRFLEIWRREADGEWRVARSMDNSASAKQQSLDFRPK